MPTHRVGDDCWQWGKSGKIYCGPGAKAKADAQGRAIYATGWREFRNEDESRLLEKLIFDRENDGFQLSEGANWQDFNNYSFKMEDYIEFPDSFQTNFTNWTKNIFLESVPELTEGNRPWIYDLLNSRQFRVGDFVEDRYFSFSMPDWLVDTNERLAEIKQQWYNRSASTEPRIAYTNRLVNEANQIMEPYYNLLRPENLVGMSLYQIWIATRIKNSAPWYSSSGRYGGEEERLEQIRATYDRLADFINNPNSLSMTDYARQMNYNFQDFYQFVIYVLNGKNYYQGAATIRTDSEIPSNWTGASGEIKRGLQWSFHHYQEITEITESYYDEGNIDNDFFYDLTGGSTGPNREDSEFYNEDGEFVEEWYDDALSDHEWSEDYGEYPLEATVALIFPWTARPTELSQDTRNRKTINDVEIIGNEYILAHIQWETRSNYYQSPLKVTLIPPEQAPRILNLQTSFGPNSVSISFALPEGDENDRYVLLRGEDDQRLTSQLEVLHQFQAQMFSPILNYLSYYPKTLQNPDF